MSAISLDLPDDLLASVEAAVRSGAYPSANAVVTAAIRSWQELARGSLRADIAVADADIAAGRVFSFDLDDIAALSREAAP